MSSDKKWNRPKELDLASNYKKVRSRERPRSTMFEDEVGKAERRSNRRMSDKKLIDDTLEDELEAQVLDSELGGWDSYLEDYI